MRLSKRRDEREQGRNDAEEDLSELSEGEKEKSDVVTTLEPPPRENMMPRIRSEMQIWSEDDKSSRNLYIVLIRQVEVGLFVLSRCFLRLTKCLLSLQYAWTCAWRKHGAWKRL